MVNPLWLRSFCTLVDVAHFTRTAQQLHMTQSGVSQHIRKLEQHFGLPLLEREGKTFRLTPAGEQLYQEAQPLLLSLSSLVQRVGHDPAYEGTVTLASPGSVGLKLYPYLLDLQQRHPALIIEYRFAPNADIERLLAERRVDIGIMTRASSVSGIALRSLAEEPLLLVTPAQVVEPDWQQLQRLGFIDHPDGAHHAALLLAPNYPEFQQNQPLKHSGFSNQISLILEPVARGLGFTVLPQHAVLAFHNRDSLCVHHLPHTVTETLRIGHASGGYLSNRVKTVSAEVEHCLQHGSDEYRCML